MSPVTPPAALSPTEVPDATDATAEADAAPDTPATHPPRRSVAYRVSMALLAGIPLMIYAVYGAEERRFGVIPSVLIEIVTWVGLLFFTMTRHPRGELRLSDPFGLMLVMFVDFFILPAITWLHGAEPERIWGDAGVFREAEVARIQYLHVLFMLSLSLAYFGLTTRKVLTTIAADTLQRASTRVYTLLFLGVAPTLSLVAERLTTGGGLLPTRTYGDDWGKLQDQVESSRGVGGSDYFVTQLFSKFWYLPLMALGVANGVLIAQFLKTRNRWKLALVFIQVPALLLLGSGGRSAVFIPFIMSMAIADVLVGPLKWRWVSIIGVVSLVGFGFYGQYRVYQDRGVSEAAALASESYAEANARNGIATEGTIMLVKEAYGLNWTDMNQFNRGFAYFPETFGAILPVQIVPMKGEWMNTANFLSRGLLGRQADYGAGVAGAVVVDGYMMFNELGVLIIGVVLGAILAGVVRGLLYYNPKLAVGPPLWRVLLLMTFNGQTTQIIRNDPGGVLNLIAYYIVLPALVFWVVLRQDSHSVWNEPIKLES